MYKTNESHLINLKTQNLNSKAELRDIQRKMVKDLIVEHITPIKQEFNIELKSHKKVLDEQTAIVKDHQLMHYNNEKVIKELKENLLKQLKNSDHEQQALNYELNRMQRLDRLKVHHAKTSFFNPDTRTVLPSLDTALASGSAGISSTP